MESQSPLNQSAANTSQHTLWSLSSRSTSGRLYTKATTDKQNEQSHKLARRPVEEMGNGRQGLEPRVHLHRQVARTPSDGASAPTGGARTIRRCIDTNRVTGGGRTIV
eukprot:276055-Prorocentrum_minimum.AAC.1